MFEYDTCNCLIMDIKMKISVIFRYPSFLVQSKDKDNAQGYK